MDEPFGKTLFMTFLMLISILTILAVLFTVMVLLTEPRVRWRRMTNEVGRYYLVGVLGTFAFLGIIVAIECIRHF